MAYTMTGTNSLSGSSIFLIIVACIYLVANLAFNFSFIVILLKSTRFRLIDRSFFFVTQMVIVDFICAFIVLVISGVGVYNDSYIAPGPCHVQTYFETLFLGITFHSLLVLSVERFIRYQAPVFHINTFTRRLVYDDEERLVKVKDRCSWIVFLIIPLIWLVNIFFSLFPLFRNIDDIWFFNNESQCDYVYENFVWFLWLFFYVGILIPFLISMIFYALTFRLIILAKNRIKKRKAKFEREVYGEVRGKINETEHVVPGVDITMQPFNTIYYDHIIDCNEPETGIENDAHVRNQLLTQFKYDTESGQTLTYFLITLFSFLAVLPVYIIHFYRSYNNSTTAFDTFPDSKQLVGRGVYTAFVWLSYMTFLLKSMFCLIQNGFFRDALYQSANCQGFKGRHDYEKEMKLGFRGAIKLMAGKNQEVKEVDGRKPPPKVVQQDSDDDDIPRRLQPN
jgi:hypothetical protein